MLVSPQRDVMKALRHLPGKQLVRVCLKLFTVVILMHLKSENLKQLRTNIEPAANVNQA